MKQPWPASKLFDVAMWVGIVVAIQYEPGAIFYYYRWDMRWEETLLAYGSLICLVSLGIGWVRPGHWIPVAVAGTLLFHLLCVVLNRYGIFLLHGQFYDAAFSRPDYALIILVLLVWIFIFLIRLGERRDSGPAMIGAALLIALSVLYPTRWSDYQQALDEYRQRSSFPPAQYEDK